MLSSTLYAAGAVVFLASLLLTPLVRSAASRWGLLDRPNERSSHSRVTPRAGGLAIVMAAGLVLAFVPELWLGRRDAVAFLTGVLALMTIGLADDRVGLSPLLRLAFQTTAAASFLAVAGWLDRLPFPPPLDLALGPLGLPVSVLWIVGVVNFFNFMDGIDGVAGVQALIAGIGLAGAGFDPFVSAMGVAVAAASAGFLVYNWSPASVFLGDGGSGALGFAFAALPFLATEAPKPAAVSFVALSLWFFLTDASYTLLRRLLRGERIHEAHREHLYQRLVIAGWSHARTTRTLGVAAAGVTVSSLLALRDGGLRSGWPLFGCAVVLFVGEIGLVRRVERQAATRR